MLKTEKSGTETPIFQVGIASDVEEKIICTSYSINAHGKDLAWKKAVDTFAKHKAIGKGTKLYTVACGNAKAIHQASISWNCKAICKWSGTLGGG